LEDDIKVGDLVTLNFGETDLSISHMFMRDFPLMVATVTEKSLDTNRHTIEFNGKRWNVSKLPLIKLS